MFFVDWFYNVLAALGIAYLPILVYMHRKLISLLY